MQFESKKSVCKCEIRLIIEADLSKRVEETKYTWLKDCLNGISLIIFKKSFYSALLRNGYERGLKFKTAKAFTPRSLHTTSWQ